MLNGDAYWIIRGDSQYFSQANEFVTKFGQLFTCTNTHTLMHDILTNIQDDWIAILNINQLKALELTRSQAYEFPLEIFQFDPETFCFDAWITKNRSITVP